jgi:hypothetical protein
MDFLTEISIPADCTPFKPQQDRLTDQRGEREDERVWSHWLASPGVRAALGVTGSIPGLTRGCVPISGFIPVYSWHSVPYSFNV